MSLIAWPLACFFCFERVFEPLLLMLASHQSTPNPGKFLAFHLESEEGLTASHIPYCAREEEATGVEGGSVRSRDRVRQTNRAVDLNILTVYLQMPRRAQVR